jgi:hypothetical protein
VSTKNQLTTDVLLELSIFALKFASITILVGDANQQMKINKKKETTAEAEIVKIK